MFYRRHKQSQDNYNGWVSGR